MKSGNLLVTTALVAVGTLAALMPPRPARAQQGFNSGGLNTCSILMNQNLQATSTCYGYINGVPEFFVQQPSGATNPLRFDNFTGLTGHNPAPLIITSDGSVTVNTVLNVGTLSGTITLASGMTWAPAAVVLQPITTSQTPAWNEVINVSGTIGCGTLCVRASVYRVHKETVNDTIVQNNGSNTEDYDFIDLIGPSAGAREMMALEMKQAGPWGQNAGRGGQSAVFQPSFTGNDTAGGTIDGMGIPRGSGVAFAMNPKVSLLRGANLWLGVISAGEADVIIEPSQNSITASGSVTIGDVLNVALSSVTNPGFGTVTISTTMTTGDNLASAVQRLCGAIQHNTTLNFNGVGAGCYGAGDTISPDQLNISWPLTSLLGPGGVTDLTITPSVTGAGTEVLTLGTPVAGASAQTKTAFYIAELKSDGSNGYGNDAAFFVGAQSGNAGWSSGKWRAFFEIGGNGAFPYASIDDVTLHDIEGTQWPFRYDADFMFFVPQTNSSGGQDAPIPNMSLHSIINADNVDFFAAAGGPIITAGYQLLGSGDQITGSGMLYRLTGNAAKAGIGLSANGWEGTAVSLVSGGGSTGTADVMHRYYKDDRCFDAYGGEYNVDSVSNTGAVVTFHVVNDGTHYAYPSAGAGSVPATNQAVVGCSGTGWINGVTWSAGNTVTLGALGQTIDVEGTLSQHGALVFNVMDYGAVGDDSTNDTTAINATFTAARLAISNGVTIGQSTTGVQIVFPPPKKAYKTTGPINGTGLVAYPNTSPVVIIGDGAYIDCQVAGKTCVDLLGDTGIVVRGLEIRGVGTGGTYPTTGFQIGRVTSASADRNVFTDVSSIGVFSIAACYVEGSEITELRHPRCYNSGTSTAHALYLDASNHANITSDFVTVTQAVDNNSPFNDPLVVEGDLRNGGNNGSTVIMTGEMFRPTLRNTYILGQGTNVAGVELYASPLAMYGVDLDIHVENGAGTIAEEVLVDGTLSTPTIHGFRMRDQTSFAATSLLALGGSVTGLTIQNPNIEIDSVNTPSVPLFDTAANYTLVGGSVWLPAAADWNAPVSNSASVSVGGVTAAGQGSTSTYGGGSNVASGTNSGVLYGNGNTASQSTAAAGGNQSVADGTFSLALGNGTLVHARSGVSCWSSNATSQGSQTCIGTFRQTGTAAMVLTMNAGAATTSNSFNNTTNNTTQSYPVKITCRDITSAGNDVTALWNTIMLSRDANAAATVLTTTSTTTPDKSLTRGTAGFTWLLAADTTNAAVTITATPPNAHTWDCAATLGPSTEVN